MITTNATQQLIRTYSDRIYVHTTTVRHRGSVVAFAMDDNRRIYYAVLDLNQQDPKKGPLDVNYWPEDPKALVFPNEIEQVGYSIAGATLVPTVKKDTRLESDPALLHADEIAPFLSTTARLTADAPFQVYSDNRHIFVFRQSLSGGHDDMLYKLRDGGSSGDSDRPDKDFVLDNGSRIPLVDSTLLCDRFVLSGSELKPTMEVRYQRSRHKTKPAGSKDSLASRDMEGKPFYEPTQELAFIKNLQEGHFSVLQLPTQVAEVKRWQFFAHNSSTGRIDAFNLEVAKDGLFNTLGTRFYTSPDPQYRDAVYEQEPGLCPFTNQPLIPVATRTAHAETCLEFNGGDYIDCGTLDFARNSYTVEGWFKTDAAGTLDIFAATLGSDQFGTLIEIRSDGKVSFLHRMLGGGGDINAITANSYTDGQWHHFAAVKSETKNCLYMDGALEVELNTGVAHAIALEVVIGRAGGLDTQYFQGQIDEIRLWNRALTEQEINNQMNQRLVGYEPGLAAYWRFDEGSGSTAYDQTDHARNGTLQGDPQWVVSDADLGDHPGMRRSSFSLAAQGPATSLQFDMGSVAAVTGYKGIGGSQPRTIEAWIKTGQKNAAIMAWGLNASSKKWTFRVQSDKGIAGTIRVEVNGGYIIGSTVVNDNAWHHVACVLENGSTYVKDVKLYVDGREDPVSYFYNRSIDTEQASGSNVLIGNDFNGRKLEGEIAEVRLWEVARSGDEIRRAMSNRLEGTETGLAAYWKCDEGQGADLTDSSPHNRNAALTQIQWQSGQGPLLTGGNENVIARTPVSGLASTLYYQQENVPTGYDEQLKPMKTHARVMLALMTTNGQPADQNYAAAIDLAVSREGRLSQVPDTIVLPVIRGGNNALLEELFNKQQELQQLRQGKGWQNEQKFRAGDKQIYDRFGADIAIDGDYAVIGTFIPSYPTGLSDYTAKIAAPLANSHLTQLGASLHGKAYIFRRDGSGAWYPHQKLQAGDQSDTDRFGWNVAISGNYVLVGDPLKDDLTGAAYIFERDAGGNWTQRQKLLTVDTQVQDHFGRSVAMSGNIALVGAHGRSHTKSLSNFVFSFKEVDLPAISGSAYIFEQDFSGIWVQKQKLSINTTPTEDFFGFSVAISGDYAVIAAPGEDAAYIFKRSANGDWVEQQKLQAGDNSADWDGFGNDVAIRGNRVIIGAQYKNVDGLQTGAAYIFERDAGDTWTQKQRLLAADGKAGDRFGVSVGISGDFAVVGAAYESSGATAAGAAYIFKRDAAGNWFQLQKLSASDYTAGDIFGESVAISDNALMIGAPRKDAGAETDTGAIYTFESISSDNAAAIAGLEQEIATLEAGMRKTVSSALAMIHTDPDGLITQGGLLDFAAGQHTPCLFDSALGNLVMYFRGEDAQFYAAYLRTQVIRAGFQLPAGPDLLKLTVRNPYASMNDLNVTVSDGSTPDTCTIVIVDPVTGIIETWPDLPRDPQLLAAILNGDAQSGSMPGTGFPPSASFLFDGVDDYIEAPYDTAFSTGTFTISMWAKATGGQGSLRSPFTFRDTNPNKGVMFYAAQDDKWQLWIGDGSDWRKLNGPDVELDAWVHLAGVYDGTTLRFYVDGQEVANVATAFSAKTVRPVRIGAGQTEGPPDLYFSGQIAQVKWYDIVQTGDDIKADMYSSTTQVTPLAYWRLNAITGGKAEDESGAMRHGTLYSDIAVLAGSGVTAPSPPGYSFLFDGKDDYIQIPYDAAFTTNTFTISLWAKVTGLQGTIRSPFTFRDYPIRGFIFFADSSDKWQFGIAQAALKIDAGWIRLYGSDVKLGEWTHLAGVYDGTTARFYINGEEVDSAATPYVPNTSRPVRIGAGRTESTPDFYFPGQIAQVKWYDIVQTGDDIKADMYSSTTQVTPLAHWPLSAMTDSGDTLDMSGAMQHGDIFGDTVVIHEPAPLLPASQSSQQSYDYSQAITAGQNYDLSGGSRLIRILENSATHPVDNGTAQKFEDGINSWWTADDPGKAYHFDGIDDYLSLPDAEKRANMDVDAMLTLEAWVKPTAVYGIQRLLHHHTERTGYTLGIRSVPNALLRFDGTDDHITLPAMNREFSQGITIEAWVYADDFAENSDRRGIVTETFPGTDSEIPFALYLHGSYHRLYAGFYDGSWRTVGESKGFPIGRWVHIAATYDGHYIRLYRDGAEIDVSSDLNRPLPPNRDEWLIGKRGDNDGSAHRWKGRITEIRIWDHARSPEELRAHKDLQLGGRENGLLAYYSLTADGVIDRSGNGYQGVLHGDPASSAGPEIAGLRSYEVLAGVKDGTDGGEYFAKGKKILPAGQWQHLAVTFEQSYGLRFEGKGYVDCGNSEVLNITGDLTLEVFLRINTWGRVHGLVGKGVPDSGGEQQTPYQLYIDPLGRIDFRFEDIEGGKCRFLSDAALVPGTFYRLGVTRKKITETTEEPGDPQEFEYQNADGDLKTIAVSVPSIEVKEWYEIRFYLDGKEVGKKSYDKSQPGNHNGNLTLGNCSGYSMDGMISEVRLWNIARDPADMGKAIEGYEEGLTGWWELQENEKNVTADSKGESHGKIYNASWMKNPDPRGSAFRFFFNGIPVATQTLETGHPFIDDWGDEQFSLGACTVSGSATQAFGGVLEEVRVWKRLRTQEQITDNLFARLKGEKQDLMAYYTFDDDSTSADATQLLDNGLQGNHLSLPAQGDNRRPLVGLSEAPVSNDAALVRSALAGIETPFHERISGTVGVQEYGDLQYDDEGSIKGIMKRCYSYLQEGVWRLFTGYKVGNLIAEWIGQAQYDPQVIGFIEGYPPVPSENMTEGQIALHRPWFEIEGFSKMKVVESEKVSYTISSSKAGSIDAAFEAARSLELELKPRIITAPMGMGISKAVTDIKVKTGIKGNFEGSTGWSNESGYGTTINRSRSFSVSMGAAWESADPADQGNPDLGRRLIAGNVGFALVQSETADVFALRLEHNKALVSFRMQPNPDIPKDINQIVFPINPRYTKQGTLDGSIGFDATGSKVTDPDYPNAAGYGEYSYFKPREAYAWKRRIEREEQQLRNYYESQDTNYSSVISSIMGNMAKMTVAAALPGGIGVAGKIYAATMIDDLVRSIKPYTDNKELPAKFAKRNIVNTYVWTADGGFLAETTEMSDVRTESTGGTFSFKGKAGGSISTDFKVMGAGVSLNFEASLGGSMNTTRKRDIEAEDAFNLEVEVDIPGDLQRMYYNDAKGVYEGDGNAYPGKVDAYRFMTFYLDAEKNNFEELYNKVIDPEWLQESDSPNAMALRQAFQAEKKPACWRVFHRVTFVSRILPEFANPAAAPLESTIKSINIDSNWQLIQKLEPFVKSKTNNAIAFRDAVRDALQKELPELVPHSEEIIQYLKVYYDIKD